MIKRFLLIGICVMALGIDNIVNAADMEAVLESNTSSTGFSVKDSNDNTLMRVQGNGNVGIGTTEPGAALHIDGSASKAELLLQASDNGKVDINLRQGTIDKAFIALSASAGGVISGSTVGDLTIRAQNQKILFSADGGTGHMAINSSGNVGIGTTVPRAKFHVFDSSTESVVMLVENSLVQGGIWASSNSSLTIGAQTNSDISLRVDNTLEVMRLLSGTGNVGIGTTAPTEKLDVAGNIKASGAVTQGSSREIKDNIMRISSKQAMKAFEQLEPVSFVYKDDSSKEERLGFIAEDVPDMVATQDRKHLNTMDLTAVLTKVVQEQQMMLENAMGVIEELKKEIKEIKGKI